MDMPKPTDQEEKLKLKALKWQSGPRKLLATFLPILILVGSFFINQYNQNKQDRYTEALESLRQDTHKGIQLIAINELSHYLDKAHHHLFDLYMTSDDNEVKNRIFHFLEPYYISKHYHDPLVHLRAIKPQELKEETEGWFYVGNFNTRINSWVTQTEYITMISFDEIKQYGIHPDSLIGKVFTVTYPHGVKLRAGFPMAGMSPVVGEYKEGTNVKVLEVKQLPQKVGAYVNAIWLRADQNDVTIMD